MSIRREPSLHQQASFVFIDNLRFLSMCAMFLEHSSYAVDSVLPGASWLHMLVITTSKFGTISFFIASGFLLGDRLQHCKPLDYLAKRVRNIFAPWAIWFLLFVILLVLLDLVHGRVVCAFPKIVAWFGLKCLGVVFGTPFWFVPNLMLSLCLLLLCLPWLDRLWLAGIFLGLSLFYGANIYVNLVPSGHTHAIGGYLFYFWVGFYGSRHLQRVRMFFEHIPMVALGGVAAVFWLCQFSEFQFIHRSFPTGDPANTLRLTSQLYSLSVAALIFRQSRAISPQWVRVRKDTFSLYLLQTPMLFLWGVLFEHLVPYAVRPLLRSAAPNFLFLVLYAVSVYLAALGLGRLFAASRYLSWMVGIEGQSVVSTRNATRRGFRVFAHHHP